MGRLWAGKMTVVGQWALLGRGADGYRRPRSRSLAGCSAETRRGEIGSQALSVLPEFFFFTTAVDGDSRRLDSLDSLRQLVQAPDTVFEGI